MASIKDLIARIEYQTDIASLRRAEAHVNSLRRQLTSLDPATRIDFRSNLGGFRAANREIANTRAQLASLAPTTAFAFDSTSLQGAGVAAQGLRGNLAQLGIAGTQATADLGGLGGATDKIDTKFGRFGTTTSGLLVPMGQTGKAAGGLVAPLGTAGTAAAGMGHQTEGLGKRLGGLAGRLGTMPALLGAVSAGLVAREVVQMADAWTLLQNRVALFTGSAGEAAMVQQGLFAVSQETRVGLADTATIYQRLAAVNDRLGLSQQGLIDIARTLNQTTVVSGVSAESASAALIQFSQGLSASELRGQELRSVLEQLPRLAQLIADDMGVSVGQLLKLGEAGELTAERLIKALQNQAAQLDSEFRKMAPTIDQSFTQLSNSLTKAVGTFGEVTGAAGVLATIIQGIARAIENVSDIEINIKGEAVVASTEREVAPTGQLIDPLERFSRPDQAYMEKVAAEAGKSAGESFYYAFRRGPRKALEELKKEIPGGFTDVGGERQSVRHFVEFQNQNIPGGFTDVDEDAPRRSVRDQAEYIIADRQIRADFPELFDPKITAADFKFESGSIQIPRLQEATEIGQRADALTGLIPIAAQAAAGTDITTIGAQAGQRADQIGAGGLGLRIGTEETAAAHAQKRAEEQAEAEAKLARERRRAARETRRVTANVLGFGAVFSDTFEETGVQFGLVGTKQERWARGLQDLGGVLTQTIGRTSRFAGAALSIIQGGATGGPMGAIAAGLTTLSGVLFRTADASEAAADAERKRINQQIIEEAKRNKKEAQGRAEVAIEQVAPEELEEEKQGVLGVLREFFDSTEFDHHDNPADQIRDFFGVLANIDDELEKSADERGGRGYTRLDRLAREAGYGSLSNFELEFDRVFGDTTLSELGSEFFSNMNPDPLEPGPSRTPYEQAVSEGRVGEFAGPAPIHVTIERINVEIDAAGADADEIGEVFDRKLGAELRGVVEAVDTSIRA